MKTKLLLFVLLGFNLTFAQNRSAGGVSPNFTGALPAQQFDGSEIFRFLPGAVTQLDSGSDFLFTNSRWFSLGRVTPANSSQTFYGSRFQLPNRSLVMGYSTTNNFSTVSNPRIQWIDTGGANSTPLEFRYASSFTSTTSTLVARMNPDGSTTFGDPSSITSSPRVVINNNADIGFKIESLTQTHGDKTGFLVNQPLGTNNNTGGDIIVGQATLSTTGLRINASTSNIVTGLTANASNGITTTIGVLGEATPSFPTSGFAAGIYGKAINVNNNQWAGFFEGRVFAQSYFRPQIQTPGNPGPPTIEMVSPRMMQVTPRKYNSTPDSELNAPTNIQHGFVAEELAKVFPELVQSINQPVFDKSGKLSNTIVIKAIDYDAMIPLLVSTVQELNSKIEALERALENADKRLLTNANGGNKVVLEQNVPNPFADRTTINYTLPEGTTSASLMVFDLNGRIVKEFPLSKNQSQITINASDIGKGLFIYSLVQNGQELISKKMVIK